MEKEPSFNLEKSNFLLPKRFLVESFDQLDDIRLVGDSREVDVGEIYSLKKEDGFVTVFSYAANPCVSGIILDRNHQLHCFHITDPSVDTKLENLISQAKKGIVGGGYETLIKHHKLFKKNNIDIILPPTRGHDFNFVLVRSKNEFHTPPGFYFHYNDSTNLY